MEVARLRDVASHGGRAAARGHAGAGAPPPRGPEAVAESGGDDRIATRGLDPAEDLLDALAATLADAVTGMSRRAPVYLGLAPLAGLGDVVLDGDMGGHLAVPQFLDKIRDVKTLVPAHRDRCPETEKAPAIASEGR